MAVRYYDDAIIYKLKKWIPDSSNLRVLRPDESKRLFELIANDSKDAPFNLPFIALSRNDDLELLLNIKNSRSYDGLKIYQTTEQSVHLNVIPIKLEYQLDIYTKTVDDGDEFLRNFLFKLINNPLIHIDIPYNNAMISHVANIRVLANVSNTSNISEHLFAGQFNRWTIQFELQDAFLFSVPFRSNWKIEGVHVGLIDDSVPDPDIDPLVDGEEVDGEDASCCILYTDE